MNIVTKVLKIIRAFLITKKHKDAGSGHFKLSSPFVKLNIKKEKGSKLILNGKLIITQYYGGKLATIISLGKNSKLFIDGDFVLGDGVKIYLSDNSELRIGGKCIEPISGITSNSMISVFKKISIGTDFLCAWNVYITDCDWHTIDNSKPNIDVQIGNHVWVGNNCNILKGSTIGNGCIVSTNSKIVNKIYGDRLLLGGIPAIIIKHDVNWDYIIN